MSQYELDDDAVRAYLASPESVQNNDEAVIVQALQRQVPLPTPMLIGAVVVTQVPVRGRTVYVRWAHDNATHSPWIEVGDHEQPYRTDQIGRIVEVLSEGVTLP